MRDGTPSERAEALADALVLLTSADAGDMRAAEEVLATRAEFHDLAIRLLREELRSLRSKPDDPPGLA